MTTIHANTPRDALTRLESVMSMSGFNMPAKAMRFQMSSAIHVIVQSNRMSDGSRKVLSIQELTGMEGDVIAMQEIFTFERTGVAPDGRVLGRFRATGIRPKFMERLRSFGLELPDDTFNPARIYE